ncbi:MAG: VOC family protein [Patescibacteria group bacterium]
MNRIVHFEIQADDLPRAAEFYRTVFGWEITKWDNPSMEYWMIMTAPKESKEPGINGGLLPRKGPSPVEGQCVNAFVCTVQVDNIDETIVAIEKAGGTLALPKFSIAGMAWQAYYKDTEGNIFGVHQMDPSAK